MVRPLRFVTIKKVTVLRAEASATAPSLAARARVRSPEDRSFDGGEFRVFRIMILINVSE
jgi:hypothetical protein